MEMIFGILIGLAFGLFLLRQQSHMTDTYKKYYHETQKDLRFWHNLCSSDRHTMEFHDWARDFHNYAREFERDQAKENKLLPENEQRWLSTVEIYEKFNKKQLANQKIEKETEKR